MKVILLRFSKSKLILILLTIIILALLLFKNRVSADSFFPGNIYRCEFGVATGIEYNNIDKSIIYNPSQINGQTNNWIESIPIRSIINVNDLYGARYPIGNSVSVPPNTQIKIGYWSYNNTGEDVTVKGIDLFTSKKDTSQGDLTNLGADGTYGKTCDGSNGNYCRSGKKVYIPLNERYSYNPNSNNTGKIFYSFKTIQPINLVSFNTTPSWQGINLTLNYKLVIKNISNYNICNIQLNDNLTSGKVYTNNLCLNSGETRTVLFSDLVSNKYIQNFSNTISISDTSSHYESVAIGKTNKYDIAPDSRSVFIFRNDIDKHSDPNWNAPQTGWSGEGSDSLGVKLIPYSFTASTNITLPSNISINKTVSDGDQLNLKTTNSHNRDNLSYTITVTNTGGKEQLKVYDQFDQNNITILDSNNGVINNNLITWDLIIEHNQTINLVIKSKINNLTQGTYNIINKTYTSHGGGSEANSLVTTSSNLILNKLLSDYKVTNSKTDNIYSNDTSIDNRTIKFILNYSNIGDADSHNTILIDDLKEFSDQNLIGSVTNISSNGLYDSTLHKIIWNLDNLKNSSSGSQSFTLILNKSNFDNLSLKNIGIISSKEIKPTSDFTTTRLAYIAPVIIMSQAGQNFSYIFALLLFIFILLNVVINPIFIKLLKRILNKTLYFVLYILTFFSLYIPKIEAATKKKSTPAALPILNNKTISTIQSGSPIQFTSLDNLLWSIIATIQLYTLPIMAITIAFLGIKLVMSGDDSSSKESIKGWIFRILFGGFMIFSATTIASIIKVAVGG